MAQTPAMDDRDPNAGEGAQNNVGALAAQSGLSAADAEAAWNAVRDALEAREAGADQSDVQMAERFDVGDLVNLFDGGKKPDLVEMAKDEMVKAVAKKLGVDPEKAAPVVDTILSMLDKPAPKRRRQTTKKKPRKTTGKRPSASSSGKKRPKAKPSSSTSKPAPKKKRPAAKPAASAAAKPKKKRPAAKPAASATAQPRTKRPAAKPKPASGSATSKPRARRTTRSNAATAGSDQG